MPEHRQYHEEVMSRPWTKWMLRPAEEHSVGEDHDHSWHMECHRSRTTRQSDVECFVAEPTVPPGFAVIDTAALAACAGDRALQRHEKLINQSLKEEPSSTIFRGIGSADQVTGEGTCARRHRGTSLHPEV
jgi:hypothetical protein